jgi:hypothetical protein
MEVAPQGRATRTRDSRRGEKLSREKKDSNPRHRHASALNHTRFGPTGSGVTDLLSSHLFALLVFLQSLVKRAFESPEECVRPVEGVDDEEGDQRGRRHRKMAEIHIDRTAERVVA